MHYDRDMTADQSSTTVTTSGRDLFLARLKAETRAAHEQTELAVALPRRLESLDAYRELLFLFLGLYEPLEEALRNCPACPAIAQGRLEKWELLCQDLGELDLLVEEGFECDNLPTIATEADCYGVLYVLEGSTLGGQIIRREVAQRFPDQAPLISRFFQPYGDRTRPMWTDFCSSLSDFGVAHPEAQDQVIASAQETFLCFERWLQQ